MVTPIDPDLARSLRSVFASGGDSTVVTTTEARVVIALKHAQANAFVMYANPDDASHGAIVR